MSRYAWLFLVKAEALEGGNLLTPGSEAMLQICVRGVELESALLDLSEFLTAERYERRDLSTARRYDLERRRGASLGLPRRRPAPHGGDWQALHLMRDHQ